MASEYCEVTLNVDATVYLVWTYGVQDVLAALNDVDGHFLTANLGEL